MIISISELEIIQERLSNCDSSQDQLDVAAKTFVCCAPSDTLRTPNSFDSIDRKIATRCNELHAYYIEFGTQFVAFKKHFMRLKTQFTNYRRMQEKEQQQEPQNIQQFQEGEISTEDFGPRL